MIITTKSGERIKVTPYDCQSVLERNYTLNFLKGQRSVGKTFSWKKRATLRAYDNSNKKFVWLRRYKTELGAEFKENFFSDIIAAANDPDSDFTRHERKLFRNPRVLLKSDKIIVNDKIVGYYYPLAITSGKKSTPFPDCQDIYFDEYLLHRRSPYHYLPDEFTTFMEFFSTVARARPNTHAYLIGNNMSWVDPYSIALGMRPTHDRFTVYKNPINGQANILLEMYTDMAFAKALYQTAIGQIIQGTAYGDYAIENRALDDDGVFIAQKSKAAFFRFALRYNGQWLGFWLDQKQGYMYVNRQVDLTSNCCFSLTRDDHSLNTLLVTQRRSFYVFRELSSMYKYGAVRFADQQVKALAMDAFQYIL